MPIFTSELGKLKEKEKKEINKMRKCQTRMKKINSKIITILMNFLIQMRRKKILLFERQIH